MAVCVYVARVCLCDLCACVRGCVFVYVSYVCVYGVVCVRMVLCVCCVFIELLLLGIGILEYKYYYLIDLYFCVYLNF